MTDNSTPPTTLRWEDPDSSWWIICWDAARGHFDATKLTFVDGAETVVDDVGFGDRRITSAERLAAEMNRSLPPEVVAELETIRLAHPGPSPDFTTAGDPQIVPALTVEWKDPRDGADWWTSWVPGYAGFYTATGVHDTDEERLDARPTVTNVGFGAPLIRTVDDLVAQIGRQVPDEVINRLVEARAEFPPVLSMTGDRPMGTRYRINLDDNSWWELGWDKPLGTFYATRFADDDELGHRVLADHGNGVSEIATIGQLGKVIDEPIPPGTAHELAADALAHPSPNRPHSLRPDALADRSPARAEWEALRAKEAYLDAWAESLAAQSRVQPLWTLPAGPVVDALRNLQDDMAAEDNVTVFATRLGLPPALVDALQTERPEPLDVDQISQVCETLRCSPYDLWGPELAQRILHAYGPERWPSHIEPLAEGRELADPAADFVRRRQLQADHDAHVTTATSPPTAPSTPAGEDPRDPPPRVTAVCYRQVGVLAEGPSGVISEVDPCAPKASNVEAYHFAFRQVTEPREVRLYPPTGIGEPAPAGHDADPTLAATADSFRKLPWLPTVDLVRFVDQDGHQEWLGWNADGDAWEAWDDPRSSYPGPPCDVLDPVGFTEPEITLSAESIEMDDCLDSSTQEWLDYGPEFPDLVSDSDDTAPLPDLDFWPTANA